MHNLFPNTETVSHCVVDDKCDTQNEPQDRGGPWAAEDLEEVPKGPVGADCYDIFWALWTPFFQTPQPHTNPFPKKNHPFGFTCQAVYWNGGLFIPAHNI